jgi:hypothetical protein
MQFKDNSDLKKRNDREKSKQKKRRSERKGEWICVLGER